MWTSSFAKINKYDVKSVAMYGLYISATVLLANLSGVQAFALNYMDIQTVNFVFTIVAITLKKFLTDYSDGTFNRSSSNSASI